MGKPAGSPLPRPRLSARSEPPATLLLLILIRILRHRRLKRSVREKDRDDAPGRNGTQPGHADSPTYLAQRMDQEARFSSGEVQAFIRAKVDEKVREAAKEAYRGICDTIVASGRTRSDPHPFRCVLFKGSSIVRVRLSDYDELREYSAHHEDVTLSIVEKKTRTSSEFLFTRFYGWIEGPLWATFESELRRLCRADHIQIQSFCYTYHKRSGSAPSEHPLGPLSKSAGDGSDSTLWAVVKLDR